MHDWRSGNAAALESLTPRVYRELYAIARANLNRNRLNQTLQPTALINELYLRLIDQSRAPDWESRSHFFGIAARLMRSVLVDYTRARYAEKRGGGAAPVTLDGRLQVARNGRAPELLEVDDALTRLAAVNERVARVIEMHYFGGMARGEIADALGVSEGTVKRDLRIGIAWMRSQLSSAE